MQIPGLGNFTFDEGLDWYEGEPILVPFLGNQCRFILAGYDDDPTKEDFVTAIKTFLSNDKSILQRAEPHIFQYYQDCNSNFEPGDEYYLKIPSPDLIWKHIRFGSEPMVQRRRRDNQIYISLECGCDWEEEHGLQIVFKNGRDINKVSQYDGHLTNSDAFARHEFENIIYVKYSDMLPIDPNY